MLSSFVDHRRDQSRDNLGRVPRFALKPLKPASPPPALDLCGHLTNCSAMALVDFHQLAVLYNLSRRDAGGLSNHSNPRPMSASTLSSLRSSVADSDHTSSSPPLPRSPPRTPK